MLVTLKKLEFLNLFNNSLSKLPEHLPELKALKYLVAANNNLTEIPNGIGALPRLTLIDLSCNSIKNIRHHFYLLCKKQRQELNRKEIFASVVR